MISTSELRMKEVINLTDGKRIGFIDDLEINLEKNRVEAIIVPKEGKFMKLFSRDNDYIIPWKNIVKIGQDVILVDLKIDLRDNINDKDEGYFEKNNNIFKKSFNEDDEN